MESLQPLIQNSDENSLSDKNLTCICGAIFKRRSCLKVHLETHTDEKAYICHYCSKAFRQLTHLDIHIKSHTGEKPYICRICGKECSTKRSLEIHLNIHTKKKSYKCDICQKTFAHRENLRRHIERHSGVKAYACGICAKCFTEQPLLTSHMRVHSGDKPYQCDTCGKKFARKQMLQCHIVIHSGEKPYKCTVCPKKFTHWPDAIKHQKIHSGIRPFTCHICSSTFVRRDHLTRHSKTHNKKHKRSEIELEKIAFLDDEINGSQIAAKKDHVIRVKDVNFKQYRNDICVNNSFVENDKQVFIKENDGYLKHLESGVNGVNYTTLKTSKQEVAGDCEQRTKMITINNLTNELDKNEQILENNIEVSEIDVKIDDSKIVEIQFVSNGSKDDVVTHKGDEYVEIKSKEELDNVVSSLSEESNVRVLIGRENDQGTWEYEEVETTVEKVVCDTPKKYKRRKGTIENTMNQAESHFKTDNKEIDLDPSTPWRCALCNIGFVEKLKLTEHVRCQHTDFSMLKKYGMKLVVNKASGVVEEIPLTLRQRIKMVPKEELQPVYNKYFSKKRHRPSKKQSMSKMILNKLSKLKLNDIKRCTNLHNQKINNLKAFRNVKKNESVTYAKNISSIKRNLNDKFVDSQNIFNFDTFKFANEDLCVILDENNYETLQEKQMIREIQDDDDCFVIIVGDDRGNGDSQREHKFQLLLDTFNVNVDSRSSSYEKNTAIFREKFKKRKISESPVNDLKEGDLNEKQYPSCTECGKQFKFLSRLKLHLQSHTNRRPFVCTKCGKTFTQNRILVTHLRTHSGETPFQCSQCGLRFPSVPKLKRHIRNHIGEKPHECEVCHIRYIKKSDLKVHMNKHTGNVQFRCKICSQEFTRREGLFGHMRTHSGERPYLCKTCGKRFCLRSGLFRHAALHCHQRKTYTCSFCPKKLSSAVNKSLHENMHRGIKQYVCAKCGKGFHRMYYLNNHACLSLQSTLNMN